MKTLKFLIPLVVAIVLVVLTEMGYLHGAALIVTWIVGFLAAMLSTSVIEVKLRLKKAKEEAEEEDE